MKRIYLDTNVFISAIKEEIGAKTRGLYIEAEKFFSKVRKENHSIVLSEWFFQEAKKFSHLNKEEIMQFFGKKEIKLEITKDATIESIEKAKKDGIHFLDAIHAATAIEQKCDCIVTFNVKDFEKAKDKINVFEPLDF